MKDDRRQIADFAIATQRVVQGKLREGRSFGRANNFEALGKLEQLQTVAGRLGHAAEAAHQ